MKKKSETCFVSVHINLEKISSSLLRYINRILKAILYVLTVMLSIMTSLALPQEKMTPFR